MTYQSVNAYCGKLLHWTGPEIELEQVAQRLGLPPDRIHMTVEVKFHVHDLSNLERERIEAMTLGNTKGRMAR